MGSEKAAELGRALWLAIKCGDHVRALDLLEQVQNYPANSVERDEALEYADKKGNGMLHVACASSCDGVEEQKKTVVWKLLRLGFILDDDNKDGKSCKDMCDPAFRRVAEELEDRQKRGGRGNSIMADHRNFEHVAEAGFTALAAIKFKNKLLKNRSSLESAGSPAKLPMV